MNFSRNLSSALRQFRTDGLWAVLLRTLMKLPSGKFFTPEAVNYECATSTIKLIHELGITPRTLVDVGAHESEWASWLLKEWPDLKLTSIDPLPTLRTKGEVIRCALSDQKKAYAFHFEWDERAQVSPVVRGDSLPINLTPPAILKIDCEDFTAGAMRGFGHRLALFDVVVVEMWNDPPAYWGECPNQQAEIWRIALDAGFRLARVVDIHWKPHWIQAYDIAFYRVRKEPQ